MSADEPTIGEVMRRLDEFMKRLDTLTAQLADDRRDFARNYVPRELYEARHLSLDRRVTVLETDSEAKEKTAAETRRQFMFMVLGIALPALGGLFLSVFLVLGDATP